MTDITDTNINLVSCGEPEMTALDKIKEALDEVALEARTNAFNELSRNEELWLGLKTDRDGPISSDWPLLVSRIEDEDGGDWEFSFNGLKCFDNSFPEDVSLNLVSDYPAIAMSFVNIGAEILSKDAVDYSGVLVEIKKSASYFAGLYVKGSALESALSKESMSFESYFNEVIEAAIDGRLRIVSKKEAG